ncbi:hypothetical protein M413DRAFT_249073 [Hebeloma cylindrosporum]|uniref:Uncharacterized protein n=1 Tax=Hebeloma cylindrosporum TaxID=76867 RepID=A0A0C3C1X8_HEBCY|nr:hypothetical protein M413DRAFT_249073 [Hebeloma cylindrosporum h7]
MSFHENEPEATNALFEKSLENVPPPLRRATLRMEFPPSYVLLGVYRLFTDKALYKPAWDKCKHGTRRGAIVGAVWAFLTFAIQKKFIQVFLSNSPKIAGLSDDTMFGYKVPFNVHTYAALMIVGSQLTYILRFFLSRNIRIARDRAWDQTVASRGKGPDFWQPYVEEWEHPPRLDLDSKTHKFVEKWLGGWFGLFIVKRVLLSPFQVYPFVGLAITAWFKALGTSHFLHRRYFEAKKMTKQQIAIYMEERKWSYRIFGFTAALLEGLPIIGLVFTVSNRVGAAMWAYGRFPFALWLLKSSNVSADLEKRQHFVAEERRISSKTD